MEKFVSDAMLDAVALVVATANRDLDACTRVVEDNQGDLLPLVQMLAIMQASSVTLAFPCTVEEWADHQVAELSERGALDFEDGVG